MRRVMPMVGEDGIAMRRMMPIVGAMALAAILSAVSWVSPLTPVVVGQHGQEHGADHEGTSRNSIHAQAAPGIVAMESIRFT